MDTIALTPEAAAYVRQHGGMLTLRRMPRHGCCGGSVALAVAELGAPADAATFERHMRDGLTVFTEPGIDGPLRVGLDRLFGLAALYVEGVEARM
jgi:hypothetical protein